MSRKIIRDFIKQADKLDNDQAARYFDTIMEVYEDCVHTANERVATLESDTLWLLVEYRRIVEAKDNTPEEKQQHRMAQGNLGQLLSVLIASTADKGIYLSEAFIKKYENVDFVGIPFGKYVRGCYNVRKWHTPEPQQKHIEAPQQPIGGSGGELAGNDKKTHKEHTKKTFKDRIAGNVDSDALIAKLHTLMDGKKGKDALIYLTVCVMDGKLSSLPTYTATKEIFPNIGCNAGYYRYTVSTKYRDSEIEGARKALNNDK